MRRILAVFAFNLIGLPALGEERLSLNQFLKKVEESSFELAIQKQELTMAEAKASGIRVEPAMLGYMKMKEEGGSQKGFEVSQALPFPTKIITEKQARSKEFSAAKSVLELERAVTLSQARLAYVSYWAAMERHRIVSEKKQWFSKHVRSSRVAARADTEAQLHFLEIEVEQGVLENDVTQAEADLEQSKNALRSYLGSTEPVRFEPLEPDIFTLEKSKVNASRFIEIKNKEFEAKDKQAQLAKQAYLPDLFVRYRDLSGERDMRTQEVMVGVSLPFLYFWQPRAESAQASAEKSKAELELNKAKVESEAQLLSLLKRSEALRAQYLVLRNKVIPNAQKRLKLVQNVSLRTLEGLGEHRTVMISFLDFRLKAVELRVEHEKALNDMAQIVGRSWE